MRDPFGRTIDYLRISVTDRCNLRCHYCLPDSDVQWLGREDLLTFEEIVTVAQTAVDLGMHKIRLTGGEPLLRSHVVDLVRMLAAIRGLNDLSMTTNGTLLAEYAVPLAEAGLHRVNISVDAVNSQSYRDKTCGGDLDLLMAGIQAAQAAKFKCIKLNCVVERSSDETDAREVADFARQNGLGVRFIRRMDLANGQFWVVEGGAGGDCPRCNRLRISCDGVVRPCLFSDVGFNVRELGVREAIIRATEDKPESGQRCHTTTFCRIGG